MALSSICGFLSAMIFFLFPALVFVSAILAMFFRVINQYERGVLFAFGKFSGILKPGLNIIIPVYNRLVRVDIRIMTVDIPMQEVMTKDNVPVKINAVVYFKVKDPEKAILNVENYMYAVSKYGQTSLRNVCGEATLDELLSKREKIASELRKIVDEATDPWGLDVTAIELMDIELPENLKRTMAKQAEAERERRGVIIKAEGEAIASENLAKAAKVLYGVKGALHLRTLHALNDISSDQTNEVIFVVPLEILRAVEEVD